MKMSPVVIEVMANALREAAHAEHGQKNAIYAKACETLGIHIGTFHRYRRALTVSKPRKQRNDKGNTGLTKEEMLTISSLMTDSNRGHGKQMHSLEDAVEQLRENGMIRAETLDKKTGELVPMSISAIGRALYAHKLHPSQILARKKHLEVESLYPNHVWQIDASLCVLYYLKPGKDQRNSLRHMSSEEFYKNKPKNLERITSNRVWSYEITDHTTGWIYVEYVMGAESGENLCSVLINAMQERGNGDVMHGVPKNLYMDPGSANTSAMTRNLCQQLGIQAIAHKAGNAQATGQVEKARDIIERKFESGLRYRPVADLDELNALARQWRIVYNARKVHSRHKMTRSHAWLKITESQLIKAPSIEVCRELAIKTPVERKVYPNLRVKFDGSEFDVSDVPGVIVGEKLMVAQNSWRQKAVSVLRRDEDGREVIHIAPLIEKGEWGFSKGKYSQVFGEYGSIKDTQVDASHKEIEKYIMGADTLEEAEAARKKQQLPFGGEFNPYKGQEEAEASLPTYMSRRGQEHPLEAPKVEVVPLNHAQAAKALRNRMGADWKPEHYGWLVQRYPDGVPEDALTEIVSQLTKPQASTLKVVGGNR